MIQQTKSSKIITSIIIFIVGAILLAKSEEVFNSITLIIGLILLLYTVVNALSFYFYAQKGYKDYSKIATTIVALIFSIIFLFFNKIIYTAFNFIVGGFILFMGINRIIKGISHKRKPLIIISIITIVLGIYIILEGTSIFWNLTGIIMMIYAITEIINIVLYGKDDEEEIKKLQLSNNTELIIPKKENKLFKKKNKNIKDIDPE